MARILATHLVTAAFGAVIALSLVAFGAISIGAVSADSGSNLGCVDSNGNGVIDVSELFDVIDAYFDGTPVSPLEPTPTPTPSGTPTPTPSPTPTASPTPTPTASPTPTPTATPMPAIGSRGNPVPLGTSLEVRNSDTDHWEVTVLETTPDAAALVLEENRFNDPPGEGNQFFIAKVRAKYLGPDSTRFGGSFRLKALGDGGVVYTTFGNRCGVIPDSLPDPELFTNGTIEGNECWEIASTDADSLLMILEREFLSTEGSRAWFSLQE